MTDGNTEIRDDGNVSANVKVKVKVKVSYKAGQNWEEHLLLDGSAQGKMLDGRRAIVLTFGRVV